MEYYSAFKKNEISVPATAWINLEVAMQSEIRQSQKRQIPCDSTCVRCLEKSKSQRQSRKVAASGRGWGDGESVFNGYGVSLWEKSSGNG